jgi:CO/xanthine dehydrogenase FAD-binding subunit
LNLNTINTVLQPSSAEEIGDWPDGYAWLAGGTWLFSTPQVQTDTLVDLQSLRWPALQASDDGLEIAATCTLAELAHFNAPPGWRSSPLLRMCCESLLASFKIWNAATVGGNICMSLPAGSLISLTTALEGVYTLWPRDTEPREVAAIDFVTGEHQNVLRPGELLRSIHLPTKALTKRFAFRRASLTHLGRTAIIGIGTQRPGSVDMVLSVTAATVRPVQIRFEHLPTAAELRETLDAVIPDADYFEDVHGAAHYKRHLTYYFAEQIRAELTPGADR